MRREIEEAELRGAAKILDSLWFNSYYSMGKEASERIETEMTYYFGKEWYKTMYKFIGPIYSNPIKTLKELKKK